MLFAGLIENRSEGFFCFCFFSGLPLNLKVLFLLKKKKKAGIAASVICFNTVSSFTLSEFALSLRHSNTFQWYDLIPDIQVQTSWALDFKDRYIVS